MMPKVYVYIISSKILNNKNIWCAKLTNENEQICLW